MSTMVTWGSFKPSFPLLSSFSVHFFLCICIPLFFFASLLLRSWFLFFHCCKLHFYVLNLLQCYTTICLQRHIFFLLATMQQFTSLHLLQHISTCIFFVLQDFFLFYFLNLFLNLFHCLVFCVCRNCISPSLFCGRSHDDFILLHLC